SEAVIPFRDGEINISQKTGYPNDGEIELTVSTDLDMQLSILLRIPGWTEGEFNLQIDGIKQKAKVEKGFIKLTDNWKGKTSILLDLPMEINMITSNPMVRENTYKIAIERGPLVYCAEGRDNEGFSVWALSVPVKKGYDVQMNEELPGGYVTISGKGIAYDLDEWEGALYKPLAVVKNRGRNVRFTLIPYYAWNNRGSSPMCVWLHIH
ncbi:MAG TPA: glycoside hydrolase family 127 protein, partial [Mesotoga sp.]|nr:glycoside hydrolase family 127 protein [Mesotoga sp.]